MKAYNTLKLMIKYGRKPKEELIKYCEAYLQTGKLTDGQYMDLMLQINEMEGTV